MMNRRRTVILIAAAAAALCAAVAVLVVFLRAGADSVGEPAGPMPEATTAEKHPVDVTPVAAGKDSAASPLSDHPLFPEAADRGCDVVLLLDGREHRGAPDVDRRIDAAKLFIMLLGTEDRIGVVGVGRDAAVLIPLTQNTEQNRPALFNAVERASTLEEGNWHDALRSGCGVLKASFRQARFFVLLAGGRNVHGIRGGHNVVTELVYAHIKLYGISSSAGADASLQRVAAGTGGFLSHAEAADGIADMLVGIFERMKREDSVPGSGNAFSVDKDIRQATIVVAKRPGTAVVVTGPSNAAETARDHGENIGWYELSHYDLITIRRPAVGVWRVGTGRVTLLGVYVLTDLSLNSSFSADIVGPGATVKMDAWLENRGGIVTDAALLGRTAFTVGVTGREDERVNVFLTRGNRSGIFSGAVPVGAPGEYRLDIVARSATFSRKKSLPFVAANVPASGSGVPQPGPAIPPKPAAVPFSWLTVLLRLIAVNLAALGLAAAGAVARMLTVKIRMKR